LSKSTGRARNGSAFDRLTFTAERKLRNEIAGWYLGSAEIIDSGKQIANPVK
jgi:hypothetical protein